MESNCVGPNESVPARDCLTASPPFFLRCLSRNILIVGSNLGPPLPCPRRGTHIQRGLESSSPWIIRKVQGAPARIVVTTIARHPTPAALPEVSARRAGVFVKRRFFH